MRVPAVVPNGNAVGVPPSAPLANAGQTPAAPAGLFNAILQPLAVDARLARLPQTPGGSLAPQTTSGSPAVLPTAPQGDTTAAPLPAHTTSRSAVDVTVSRPAVQGVTMPPVPLAGLSGTPGGQTIMTQKGLPKTTRDVPHKSGGGSEKQPQQGRGQVSQESGRTPPAQVALKQSLAPLSAASTDAGLVKDAPLQVGHSPSIKPVPSLSQASKGEVQTQSPLTPTPLTASVEPVAVLPNVVPAKVAAQHLDVNLPAQETNAELPRLQSKMSPAAPTQITAPVSSSQPSAIASHTEHFDTKPSSPRADNPESREAVTVSAVQPPVLSSPPSPNIQTRETSSLPSPQTKEARDGAKQSDGMVVRVLPVGQQKRVQSVGKQVVEQGSPNRVLPPTGVGTTTVVAPSASTDSTQKNESAALVDRSEPVGANSSSSQSAGIPSPEERAPGIQAEKKPSSLTSRESLSRSDTQRALPVPPTQPTLQKGEALVSTAPSDVSSAPAQVKAASAQVPMTDSKPLPMVSAAQPMAPAIQSSSEASSVLPAEEKPVSSATKVTPVLSSGSGLESPIVKSSASEVDSVATEVKHPLGKEIVAKSPAEPHLEERRVRKSLGTTGDMLPSKSILKAESEMPAAKPVRTAEKDAAPVFTSRPPTSASLSVDSQVVDPQPDEGDEALIGMKGAPQKEKMIALTETFSSSRPLIPFSDTATAAMAVPQTKEPLEGKALAWLEARSQELQDALMPPVKPKQGGSENRKQGRSSGQGSKVLSFEAGVAGQAKAATANPGVSFNTTNSPITTPSSFLQNATLGLLNQLQASGQQYLKSALTLPNGAQLQFVMRVSGETVHLRMTTDDASVKRELNKGWDKLSERAAKRGITLGSPEIIVSTQGDADDSQQQRQPHSHFDPEVA